MPYPPNGILPFRGITAYAMPICFIHQSMESAYYLFREFYARHLCRLHIITTRDHSLLHLCHLFCHLLASERPHLYRHMMHTVHLHPLTVAFPWLRGAFVGYLAVDQVLLLWDRILGFDSVEVLALVAYAIFAFRANELLELDSISDVEVCCYPCLHLIDPSSLQAAFDDLRHVRVIPLLQYYIFQGCKA